MSARADQVRLRFIESMRRRAADHEGATRHLLDRRLATLVATAGVGPPAALDEPDSAGPSPPGLLAELVAQMARQEPGIDSATLSDTLDEFRRIWSRLSADQRLAHSLSSLPGNAGPLHSHQLVHRSLASMRQASPGYFERFVGYLDALLWIESANASREAVPLRKPTRGRRS